MALANIEREFVNNILKPEMELGFLSKLLPLDSLTEERQLSIYRSNANGAHQKVLAQVYPACFNVLGEDYFNQLCRIYRFSYPSLDADLNKYGDKFSLFLAEQIKSCKELVGFEYLAELAYLEWCWHSSYYAKDDENFPFDKLSLVNETEQSNIFFNLSDSFSLHSTKYPLLQIWNANKATIDDMQVFDMPVNKKYFCIHREAYSPLVFELDIETYILLKSIRDNMSLIELTSITGFDEKLAYSIKQGWVTDFFVKD